MIGPLPLLLFGLRLDRPRGDIVEVDSWLRFIVPPELFQLFGAVRRAVSQALKDKIENPSISLSEEQDAVIAAVAHALAAEEAHEQARAQKTRGGSSGPAAGAGYDSSTSTGTARTPGRHNDTGSGVTSGLCFDFARGECGRGDQCKFSHGGGPRGGDRSGEKPGPCFDFAKGRCTRGVACRFSHDG